MKIQMRKKNAAVLTSTALVVIAALISLHVWWNTNTFGAQTFCDDRMKSQDVQAALDVPGRVSKVFSQVGTEGRSEFNCGVERTSRFMGAEDVKLTVKTGNPEGAFPFTTAVWQNPAERSYFMNGLSGAVSGNGGYVVLPKSCWDKVGRFQGGISLPKAETVSIVEASVEGGSADRKGLARLLVHSAQKVAKLANCSPEELKEPTSLAAPAERRKTDPDSVCGLEGFSLPRQSLVEGVAELGHEQLNKAAPHTWACDMTLDGTSDSEISFVTTSDPSITDAALRDQDSFKRLPGKKGFTGSGAAVIHCESGDRYFGVRWSHEYGIALSDSTDRGYQVKKGAFQDFLDAAAKANSCPSVSLPSDD